VLARLQEQSGVETAEVDRRGELLRLRLTSPDVTHVIDRLQELGFLGEVVRGTESVAALRWYGLGSVSELSREEADVIAQRVVPVFAEQNGIGVGETEAVKEIVATALHTCFTTQTLDATAPHGALNDACGRAVAEATLVRLGPDRATALGRAIEGDLASRSAFKE
jgi:hypothetical protein